MIDQSSELNLERVDITIDTVVGIGIFIVLGEDVSLILRTKQEDLLHLCH